MSEHETGKIILDKAYPLAEAAGLMGLKHANDVVRLHDQGEITLRMRKVRGLKGRPVLLGAEIVRFNTHLPERPRKQRFAVPLRPLEELTDAPLRTSRRKGVRRVGRTVAEDFSS